MRIPPAELMAFNGKMLAQNLLQLAAASGLMVNVGCLRFGYDELGDAGAVPRSRDAGVDSGSPDSGRSDGSQAGGTVAGSGGTNSSMLDSGVSLMDAASETDAAEPLDAGAADGGVVRSEKCLERSGALFCDGFEVDDPDNTHWSSSDVSRGALERSMAQVHSGLWSLRATINNGSGRQASRTTLELANQKSGDAWLRFYALVPSTVEIKRSFSIGSIRESVAPFSGFELRILQGDAVDISASSLGEITGLPDVTYARDRWVCVEMHVCIDAANGYYEAYLDNALAARSELTDTTTANGYTAAALGICSAPSSQGPVELFVDDAFVARERMGCN
jgi:hypothetical protein